MILGIKKSIVWERSIFQVKLAMRAVLQVPMLLMWYKFLMINIMEFTVAVSKDQKSKWYIGQCVEVRGAFSQGRSLEELLSNMKEAISLVVDYRREELEKDPDWENIFYRKVEI